MSLIACPFRGAAFSHAMSDKEHQRRLSVSREGPGTVEDLVVPEQRSGQFVSLRVPSSLANLGALRREITLRGETEREFWCSKQLRERRSTWKRGSPAWRSLPRRLGETLRSPPAHFWFWLTFLFDMAIRQANLDPSSNAFGHRNFHPSGVVCCVCGG